MPRPRPLTLIAPLKSQDPASLQALEMLMRERGHAIFEGSPSTHMAALVMLGDRQRRQSAPPARGGRRQRPNVVANFAGVVTDAQGPMSPAQRLVVALGALVSTVKGRIRDLFFGVLVALAQRFMLWLLKGKKPRSAAANLGQTLDRDVDVRYQQVQAGQVQNQMTNISWVLPGRVWLLRLGLAAVNFAALYAYPPGDLAGVKSVHFARWVLIDDNTGLLFEGDFDGTWEDYMGEFADRVAWGLDMIWGNTETYPPAGMRDIWAFKRYIGNLQYPPAMWYMAGGVSI